MTSQPRKFSEKIALHNQKQAEGDEAFRQIMREVTDVTSNPARGNSEDVHCSRVDSNTVYRERGRSVGSVGPMRSRPVEKRVDTSPYSCGPYLSPPSADLSWRRTSSDSALHQSVQNPNNTLHNPGSQRRVSDNQHYDKSRVGHILVSSDKRPRSCFEVPSVPNINVFLSQQEPGTKQIPIGNSTGSLPDLTSFQFSSPIHTPLDQDDHHSSTYSSASPQCTSPSTLSPTSLPPRTPGRFSFGSTPPHESSEPHSYASVSPPSPSGSEHLSVPLANSRYIQNSKGFILDGSPTESGNYQIQPQMQQQQQQQQSLHKQSQFANHQQQQHHHHHPHQIVYQQQQQQQSSQQQQTSQNHQPQMQSQRIPQFNYPQGQSPVSPVAVPTSDSINHTQPRNSMTSYRSPQPTNRPSPQSSPTLNIKHYSNNPSPLSSAPQSPTSSCNSVSSSNMQQPYNSNDYCETQAHETLQQCFEQIRMGSPVSSTDYMIPMSNGPPNSYQQSDEGNAALNELTSDQGYYASTAQQLQYRNTITSAQITPNTPSAIPDIVITSTNDELVRRDKEFGCDISNFGEGLREGLDHFDIDGFFTQEILNSDPSSQEHFALDH